MEKLHSLDRLINSLSKLPGVGYKTAERMAYSILNFSNDDIKEFSNSLLNLKEKIHTCPICGAFIEEENCPICFNKDRDHKRIMVVAYPKDVITLENSSIFDGVYHVLNGVISSKNGLNVEDLRINELLKRVDDEKIEEVIIATNPDVDGETTALYISKRLEGKPLQVTRLGYGLQMGANLDYVDPITLSRALEGRKKI